MLVWVFIKHKKGQGKSTTTGDVIYIYPITGNDIGKETLNYFFPVKIDLNIPCGFKIINGIKQWDCNNCPDNDPASCDVIKYMAPKWDNGSITESPKMKNKRRYKINLRDIITENEELLIKKHGKTTAENSLIMSKANSGLKTKDKIREKS